MVLIKHIAFRIDDHPALWDYISKNSIPIDHREGDFNAALDILTSSPHWPWISDYVQEHRVFCLSDMVFAKEELQNAEWLCIRCTWKYGYPEPAEDHKYEAITYTRENTCIECNSGLVQKDSFRFKKTPAWRKRHFCAPFWIEDELFVSDYAKNVLRNTGVSGISFMPVLNKNGKEILKNVHQLVIPTVLEKGLIERDSYLKRITACSQCHTKKYCLNGCGPLIMCKEVFANVPDIVKTAEIFGGTPGFAARKILINQKVYQIIVDNKLDQSLVFYPIDLR